MPMIDGIDDRDIQKFEIDDSIISDKQIIGSFNLNMARIKLINAEKKYSNLKGQWLSTILGQLYVYEAPEAQGDITIELKCYDLAYKFDQTYHSTIDFPTTVGEWLQSICDVVGVTLATPEFTNSEVELETQPFLRDEASYREAVKEIAAAAGGFAQIIDNQLHIRWFDSGTHDIEDWFELNQEEQTDGVNVVVLGRGDLEDNIAYPKEIPEDAHELRIDDNQILLDREQDLVEPIYNQVKGFSYRIFNMRTMGLRNVKAGQKVKYIDIDHDEVTSPIMSHTLTFLGGDYNDPTRYESRISAEQINETNTNYQYAGNVIKTLRNTEAKVDKQNQQIEFVVEEQRVLNDEVASNYVKTMQTISEVVTSVQNSGGNNLIRNSAMYFKEQDGTPSYWTLSNDGSLKVMPSAEAASYGSLSGQAIQLLGKTITQAISVKADDDSVRDEDKTYYTFSCRVRKVPAGDGYIRLTDGHNEWKIEFPNGFSSAYKEFTIESMLPVAAVLVLEVYGSSESELCVTDMMLSVGNYRSQWTQANGELANTQTQIDIKGVTVTSSTASISSQLTPQGLQTKSGSTVISSLTNDGLSTPKIAAKKEISMPPIKIVTQTDGWAFVPTE